MKSFSVQAGFTPPLGMECSENAQATFSSSQETLTNCSVDARYTNISSVILFFIVDVVCIRQVWLVSGRNQRFIGQTNMLFWEIFSGTV